MDSGKVADHHTLLITGERPLFLSKEDSIVYQMATGHMIEALSEKCTKSIAAVATECGGIEFTVRGSVIR